MDGEEWQVNRRIMNNHLLHNDTEAWLDEPVKLTITKFVNMLKSEIQLHNRTPILESELYKLSTHGKWFSCVCLHSKCYIMFYHNIP